MKNKHVLTLAALLILAGLLTFFKVPLASSQGQTLTASFVQADLPVTDPDSNLWQSAAALEVPLSAQQITAPMQLVTHTRSVTARLLQNEEHMAILVEWDDETQNDSSTRVQDFRDMVAVQFPESASQPYFCMGQADGNVNVWAWKADWQAAITSLRDVEGAYPEMYVDQYPFTDPDQGSQTQAGDYSDRDYLPALQAGNLSALPVRTTPVENLVAGGFGSLTTLPEELQHVQGYGTWQNGKWRVIFSRRLTPDVQGDVAFTPGKTYSIAFAVWDGANYERNGQKSTSQWVSLQLRSIPKVSAGPEVTVETPFWREPQTIVMVMTGAFVFLFILGALIYRRLPD